MQVMTAKNTPQPKRFDPDCRFMIVSMSEASVPFGHSFGLSAIAPHSPQKFELRAIFSPQLPQNIAVILIVV